MSISNTIKIFFESSTVYILQYTSAEKSYFGLLVSNLRNRTLEKYFNMTQKAREIVNLSVKFFGFTFFLISEGVTFNNVFKMLVFNELYSEKKNN